MQNLITIQTARNTVFLPFSQLSRIVVNADNIVMIYVLNGSGGMEDIRTLEQFMKDNAEVFGDVPTLQVEQA
jgi:hypothetical protein